jgi:hypothetical protein
MLASANMAAHPRQYSPLRNTTSPIASETAGRSRNQGRQSFEQIRADASGLTAGSGMTTQDKTSLRTGQAKMPGHIIKSTIQTGRVR